MIKKIYISAGLINITGMLLFSKFFTNHYLQSLYPAYYSTPSMILIMLWGLAYLIVSNDVYKSTWMHLLFSAEKLFYFFAWIIWMKKFYLLLPTVFEKDFLTGLYYVSFGLNDLFFALFFFYVFITSQKHQKAS